MVRLAALALGVLLALCLAPAGATSGAVRSADREVERPRMLDDRISFGAERKRQTARYSKRHYGERDWRLEDPRAVVLHWTAGRSWEGARDVFAANRPSLGERPGVCAHYIIEKSGKIHLTVSERIRCRHAIGLNWTAIGIEFVQEAKGSSAATDRAILGRRRQMRTGLRLVAYLRDRYDIKTGDVIGHATANDSPLFRERRGWRNDHSDWGGAAARKFRAELRKRFG